MDKDIQTFWSSLYNSLYEHIDEGLTPDALLMALDDLEDMFRLREHMSMVEMPIDDLAGLEVLEIGSGAGGHSAWFSKKGAKMTSVDLTWPRVASTRHKLNLLAKSGHQGQALQASAEALPFASNSFDIVYSNGVLHHAADTELTLREVHRVLRPGGSAVIMLYCKDSWHYWFNLLFCEGILKGGLFKSKNWLGHATEWGGKHQQDVLNPYTRCYSRGELLHMFADYNGVSLRKREFYFYLIPVIGKYYRKFQRRRYGAHPGGYLVYGEPWIRISKLEYFLGRLMGWAWYIKATKP